MRSLVLALIASAAVAGCARKPAPAGTSATAQVVQAPITAAEAAPREKQPRIKDGAVYVDGKITGFLKFNELPPGLVGVVDRPGETEFGFASYLKALGVDVAKVRALHMHGGRVSMLPGDSLRRGGDRVRFVFRGDGSGPARPRFAAGIRPSMGLNTAIDMISAVSVYVDKEPPTENADFVLVYPDGTLVGEGMPYADAEASAGTRVYFDGKLVSIVKRKSLSNDLLATDDLSKPKFSLAAYLKAAGVDTQHAKRVELLGTDGEFVGVEPKELASMTFAVPARNKGLAVIDYGTTSDRKAAIQIYQHKTPPRRALPNGESTTAPTGSKTHTG